MELKTGDPVFIAPRGAGFFVLDEVPDADTLWAAYQTYAQQLAN